MADYDIEIVTPPVADAELDVVSREDLKKHLRMFASGITTYDDVLDDCIRDAVGSMHGQGGKLNRTVLPMTWKRHWKCFPTDKEGDEARSLWLPYVPVTSVTSVEYRDVDGATQTLSSANYILIAGFQSARVQLLPSEDWPVTEEHPRAVTVTYVAGYTTYPSNLKRLTKMMAGHNFENLEATINDPRVVIVNRRTEFAHDYLVGMLKVQLPYGDER